MSATDVTTQKRFALRGWMVASVGILVGLAYGMLVVQARGAPLVLMGLGGLTVALCGMALFRMIDPLLRPAAAAARAEVARQSVRQRELEHEKTLVLKAIREIEHDYQMRKIGEQDYKEMSHRYRARAMRLIQEIDAGDDFRGLIEAELKTRLVAMTAAVEAARMCPECETVNEQDAQFCKKCGSAMPVVATAAAVSSGGSPA